MYAAHFAAGLAIKGRVPQAPTSALMMGVFLPDLLWVVLARAGIEPEYPPRGFFDDWSHSVLMIVVWSTLFAFFFWKRDHVIAAAVWVAGLSHFVLDFLIHPSRLALYPHSPIHVGWMLWQWGQQKSRFGPNHYWWVETACLILLLTVYGTSRRRSAIPPEIVMASCLLVAGLHLLSA